VTAKLSVKPLLIAEIARDLSRLRSELNSIHASLPSYDQRQYELVSPLLGLCGIVYGLGLRGGEGADPNPFVANKGTGEYVCDTQGWRGEKVEICFQQKGSSREKGGFAWSFTSGWEYACCECTSSQWDGSIRPSFHFQLVYAQRSDGSVSDPGGSQLARRALYPIPLGLVWVHCRSAFRIVSSGSTCTDERRGTDFDGIAR
jgi:hypothetical protein